MRSNNGKLAYDLGDFQSDTSSFSILFQQIEGNKPAPDRQYCYRRNPKVVTLHDEKKFPNFSVVVEAHGEKFHLLHDSPKIVTDEKKYVQDGLAFFSDVLLNPHFNIKKVVLFTPELSDSINYFKPLSSPDKTDPDLLGVEKKLQVKIVREIVEKKDSKQFKLMIKPIPDSPLKSEKVIYIHLMPRVCDFRAAEFQNLLEIYRSEGDLAIHGNRADTYILEFAYCLFGQYDTFYPKGIPDFLAMQEKLEKLRIKRPGMIIHQNDYRAAIVLAEKFHLMGKMPVINASSIERKIDQAAKDYVVAMTTKKIDRSAFEKLNAVLKEKDILHSLVKYREAKGVFLFSCVKQTTRRSMKRNIVVMLNNKLSTAMSVAVDQQTDFNALLSTVVEEIGEAIQRISCVSSPKHFGFFKRKYKEQTQKPGSHLLPILEDLVEEIRKQFKDQLAVIDEQKKHFPPAIDLKTIPFRTIAAPVVVGQPIEQPAEQSIDQPMDQQPPPETRRRGLGFS